MEWEPMLTKGANAAIVLAFFGLIVLFLRFLYGPKGILRSPEWDKWNEQARRELEQEVDAKADKALERAFHDYAASWMTGNEEDDAPLHLKIEHSLCVLAHAREIAAAEPAFAGHDTGRALRLSSLFHDVGRFEQYRKYKTFADARSCNHGLLGAGIIRRQGFLKNETPEMRRMVKAAVASHNRITPPKAFSGEVRDVLDGLRDADKLDILRVMAANLAPGAAGDDVVLLHLEDKDGAWSPEVEAALDAGRTALYADMRYVNDFRILLCTWIFSLRFDASRRILQREGHLDAILAGLGNIPAVQAKAAKLVAAELSHGATV